MKRLEGKTAIVTGGGRGLGRAMALAFAAEGANVGIIEIDAATAEATAAEIVAAGGRTDIQIADLADRGAAQDAIDAVSARFGRLDILVNNAIWIR
ncbi:SDR family NAD(P)-dependent oxidoreductase, partial [Rhizobiaceae sp. 2RAB30]